MSGLLGREELVLFSLNGKVQGARVHFSRHNDRSGRTERLRSISRDLLARTSSENSCVPFKNWMAGPDRPDKWKVTLEYVYTVWHASLPKGLENWEKLKSGAANYPPCNILQYRANRRLSIPLENVQADKNIWSRELSFIYQNKVAVAVKMIDKTRVHNVQTWKGFLGVLGVSTPNF